jgi:hypothetical protein
MILNKVQLVPCPKSSCCPVDNVRDNPYLTIMFPVGKRASCISHSADRLDIFSEDAGLIVPVVLRAPLVTALGLALFAVDRFGDTATRRERGG